MFRKRRTGFGVVIVFLLFILVSFPLNSWFSSTMPRHQLLQLPLMLVLGLSLARLFPKFSIKDTPVGIALLIFVMFSFIFWMLPRSIDLAVVKPSFNRIMHLNIFISGFLIPVVFRGIMFEVKVLFLGMLTAMVLATGITLRTFDILLCSAFNIAEQKETGFYLILISIFLMLSYLVIFFRMPGKAVDTK